MVGIVPYHFFGNQQMIWGREFILWDKNNHNNPFQWQNVRSNMPPSKKYDPELPSVIKVRVYGNVENEPFSYIYDVRALGQCDRECWRSTRNFAFKYNYIGMQDTTIKIRGLKDNSPGWYQ